MRTRWLAVAALAALVAAAPSAGAAGRAGDVPPEFLGSWKGMGSQNEPPGDWSIATTIADGPRGGIVGTITYPTSACGGDLVLRSGRTGRLVLLERITFGDCIDGGVITLTSASDGLLTYDWKKEGDTVVAQGVLRRAR